MKKAEYIIELAKGNMSLDGYDYIVSLVKYYLSKYSWPKIVLDDNINTDRYWTDDEVLSFTQQLLMFIIEKGKLKNYFKIPDNYIEYYFKTIIVSYVSTKIKEYQNKKGLSFDDTRRISLEILNEHYFSKEYNNSLIWNKENLFENPIIDNNQIIDKINSLPKIPITEKTKHYKPRVKTALNDIFNLINKPILQSVLLDNVFKLFDQSSFVIIDEEQTNIEFREDNFLPVIENVISNIDKSDIPIYLDYFFSETKNSLNTLSKKYNIPKSTIHYKINLFKNILIENFTPENEQEGVWFLKKLHNTLDELK